MFTHLQPRSYYEDLYDRRTVEICRLHEKHSKRPPEIIKTNRSTIKITSNIGEFLLSLTKGERYYRKNEVINKWMDRDRELDQITASAKPPEKVVCVVCKSKMELLHSRLIYFDVKTPHMEYTFGCRECQSMAEIAKGLRKARFPWQCPKCKRRMTFKTTKSKRKLTTNKSCECGYKDVDVLDFNEIGKSLEKPLNPEEERQYQEDKLRFCLTPEEARNYVDMQQFMASIQGLLDKKAPEEMLPELEELTLTKLKQRVSSSLKGKGYTVVKFGKPKLDDNVDINLTATDDKERTAFTSKKEFRRILNDSVEGTNWKLIKSSVQEKLGVLKARLQSFEQRRDIKF